MKHYEIGKEVFHLPTNWEDITLAEFASLDIFLERVMPEVYRSKLPMQGEDEEAWSKRVEELNENQSEEETITLVEFYADAVGFLGRIPKELVRQVPLESILDMYHDIKFLTEFPTQEEIEIRECIEFDGVKYYADQKDTMYIGQQIDLHGMGWGTMRDAISIQSTFKKLGSGDFNSMDLFTAIIFRPMKDVSKWWQKERMEIEPYDEETSIERRVIFAQVTMDKIWGAYFFLQKQLESCQSDTLISLSQVTKAKPRPRIAQYWRSILGN